MLFVAMWAGLAAMTQSRLLPGPIAVVDVMAAEALHGPLLSSLAITLARVGVAFVLSMMVGTALGLLLGRYRRADAWLDPWLLILLNTPALVIVILAYVWLGLTEAALLTAVVLNKAPNVAVTIREGARALDRDLEEMAEIYRLGVRRRFRDIVLPQLGPYMAVAGRNGIALIWKIVLVVELLGRSNGVGFELQISFQLFDVSRIIAYSASFVLCALLLEALIFAPTERRLSRWRR